MLFYKKYKPLLELNNSKFNVIALTGGRGSQKTGHALRGVLTCSMQDKKKTCFFRETKDTLANSIKAELEGILDDEFSDRGYSYTNDYVRHINGSSMFFKGLKEVNKASIENLKGIATTTDFFVVDEAQAVSKAVWDVLIPTLRKEGCVLIVIYNRIADDLPVEEALFLDYDTMTAPEGTYFIEVNYTEIIACEGMKETLSKQFVERAELVAKNKPDEYAQYYLNKPVRGNQNYVVRNFTSDNIVDEINHLPDMPLHIACDFNVDPMAWLCLHIDWDEKKMYYFDEIVVENTDTRECIEEFARRYPPAKVKAGIVINGDASGNNRSTQAKVSNYVQIKNRLKELGYNKVEIKIKAANPPILRRIKAWNDKVLTTQGERDIIISKKCKWLLYNCRNLKFKEGTTIVDLPSVSQMQQNKDMKFLEHPFDAASYPVDYYFPVKMDYS